MTLHIPNLASWGAGIQRALLKISFPLTFQILLIACTVSIKSQGWQNQGNGREKMKFFTQSSKARMKQMLGTMSNVGQVESGELNTRLLSGEKVGSSSRTPGYLRRQQSSPEALY